ncbi:MAG: transcription antitermination factor NusB [Spirochaetales bacterium]|nr:MAG: transcription antitermination factor NusB [Spirochaetales bacterium]
MGIRREGRIVAFQALYAWEETRIEPAELIQFEWMDTPPEEKVRVFASLIVQGTLESLEDIDSWIRKCLKKWSFERLNKVDLAILRTGTYALLYQQDIPPSVSIDESVEIAKQFAAPDSFRFINGVLDGIRKAALS